MLIYKNNTLKKVECPLSRGAPAPFSACLVEVVEEGGDAALVGLVHDHLGALGRGLHVEMQDAAFDARQRKE